MKSKIARVFVVFLLTAIVVVGLTQEIAVGQRVPDIFLSNIFRYRKKQGALLNEFGGKPLIIDFWFTHCSACIGIMPKMDSLQKEFSDRLNILLVTYEPESLIVPFLKSKRSVRDVGLPSVTSDTILKKLFPHRTAPHEVWIDKDGIVRAITGYESVTRENVTAFVNGGRLEMPLKSETKNNDFFTGKLPFMEIAALSGRKDNILQYSYLGGYDPQISTHSSAAQPYNLIHGTLRVKLGNQTFEQLYAMAYNNLKLHPTQIIKEYANPKKYDLNWKEKKNIYCYDKIMQTNSVDDVYRAMQQDLDNYFNLRSTLIKRKIKCYVLRRTSVSSGRFLSKGEIAGIDKVGGKRIISNIPMNSVIENNLFVNLGMPLIDETGISDHVDLEVPIDVSDLEKVNQFLEKFDLVLQTKDVPMDVILLR